MKHISSFLCLFIIFCFFSCDDGSTTPDTSTETVTIGTQTWMLYNLSVEKYRNGDAIPQIRDSAEWANCTTGAWCYYANDDDSYMSINPPKLYNWYAVSDPRGLAPEGWHIPSETEMNTLENYLGGVEIAGAKLKDSGTVENNNGVWLSPNTGATNLSGFTAFPWGYRDLSASFKGIGEITYYWTSSEDKNLGAKARSLSSNSAILGRANCDRRNGFSVRCIKD